MGVAHSVREPPPQIPASWSCHLSVTPPLEWGLDLVTCLEGRRWGLGLAAAVGHHFQDYVIRRLWLLSHALPLSQALGKASVVWRTAPWRGHLAGRGPRPVNSHMGKLLGSRAPHPCQSTPLDEAAA